MRYQYKKAAALILTGSFCFSTLLSGGYSARAAAGNGAQQKDGGESEVNLSNPVIDPENSGIYWDCVYFGNYWQSRYLPVAENEKRQREGDEVLEDTDGTKYLLREDGKCYKYEPIQWRVLSVSEDGSDAFLIADKNLDVLPYHSVYSDAVTWANADVRIWLNEEFLNTAFTEEERNGILLTTIENRKTPEYVKEEEEEEEAPTSDYVYLLSREEATTRKYGFTDDINETATRKADNTDFTASGGTAQTDNVSADYLLRTMGAKGRVSYVDYLTGNIPAENVNALLPAVNEANRIRPVLHLDLTKAQLWTYAGKAGQDRTQIAPDDAVLPIVPTQKPENIAGVTMTPGQMYPKNPVICEDNLKKNTWDCVYFGRYYNTGITPPVLAAAGEHDTVKDDAQAYPYLARHEQGYFWYEPMKWRVLSVNEDGTDAFLMADDVIDVAPFDQESGVEITWEKSDIRKWLNKQFIETAFTAEEREAVKMTDVTTPDNQWSDEPGGNDTKDKIYLPSVEEMLFPAFGFSSDTTEGDTRRAAVTNYVKSGGTPYKPAAGFVSYWLRSPGTGKGCPAQVGHWGEGEILTEPSVMLEKAGAYLGVRPVMHVDLSDTSLWTYAGQVTPEGVVVPEEKEPQPDTPQQPVTPQPDTPQQPVTPQPDTPQQPEIPVQNPQQTEKKVKKPGKPKIKKLVNKKGKKAAVTLDRKVSGAVGYQVAYATKESMKGQKTKFFKGTTVTLKGLKKKKTYYIRVRAYKVKDGKKVYGDWGNKKSIKIKK